MDDKSNKDAPLQPNNDETKTEDEKKGGDENDLHPRIKQLTDKVHEKDSEIAELRESIEELKESVQTRQTKEDDDELSAEEEETLDRIMKAAKKKGLIVTKEDLNVEKRAGVFKSLTQKHDGSDGLPKFDQSEVVVFAKANGFDVNNEVALEAAYRTLHAEAISQKDQSGKDDITVPDSEAPTKNERKVTNELTAEQIAMMSDEEYEKVAPDLLAGLKKRAKELDSTLS